VSQLSKNWYFTCECPVCSDPEGESWKRGAACQVGGHFYFYNISKTERNRERGGEEGRERGREGERGRERTELVHNSFDRGEHSVGGMSSPALKV
jgi:hypothetical protein